MDAVGLLMFSAVSREGPVVADRGGHPGASGEAATGEVDASSDPPGEEAARDIVLVVPVEKAIHP